MPAAKAIMVTRVIAEAMAVAHENGIVHRDLKPDNIILTSGSKSSRVGPQPVKILDFGIAKLNASSPSARITKTGTLMGTPLYMSPEQCQGAPTVDARSDIYSLGCILYAMLTGSPPFPRSSDGVALVAHIMDPVPPLEEHGVSVPAALEATLMKALAKDPAERQQNMTELVAELDAADASPGKETMKGRAEVVSIPPGEAPPAPVPAPPAPATSAPAKPRVATPMAAPVTAPRPVPSSTAKATVVERTTTLHRATGEVAVMAPAARRRSPILWVGVTAGMLLGIGGALYLGKPRPARRAARATAALTVPAPPVAPTPPPKAAVPPEAPAQVTIELVTDPPGATVWNAAERAALGLTPLRASFDRGARIMQLRIEKRGFRTETIDVDLNADFQKSVTLRPRPRVVVDPDEGRKL
jgi:serine/threonine-protein kinase